MNALQTRLNQFDDFQIVRFYDFFTQGLLENLSVSLDEIIAGVPAQARQADGFDQVTQLSAEQAEQALPTAQAAMLARRTLLNMADDPTFAPLVEEGLRTYKDDAMIADLILATGLAASLLLLVSTTKLELKFGGVTISKDSVNLGLVGALAAPLIRSFPGGKAGAAQALPPPNKILFFSANPRGTPGLRLDEEVHAIDETLLKARFRERFDLQKHFAVRVGELQSLLLRCQPDIIHFSGHGSPRSEIVLEDAAGNPQVVPAAALSDLFHLLKDNIRCVLLNACFSLQQAQAIAQHIDCVIGMTQAVGDRAALNFATAFYEALAYGRDVQTAFELGVNQVLLQGLPGIEKPQLLTRAGVDARTIIFT